MAASPSRWYSLKCPPTKMRSGQSCRARRPGMALRTPKARASTGREHDAAADRIGLPRRRGSSSCRPTINASRSAWRMVAVTHRVRLPSDHQRRRESHAQAVDAEATPPGARAAIKRFARRQCKRSKSEGEGLTTCGDRTAIARWNRRRCICVHRRAQPPPPPGHDEPRTNASPGGSRSHYARSTSRVDQSRGVGRTPSATRADSTHLPNYRVDTRQSTPVRWGRTSSTSRSRRPSLHRRVRAAAICRARRGLVRENSGAPRKASRSLASNVTGRTPAIGTERANSHRR